MKRIFKSTVSILLVLCMMLSATVAVFPYDSVGEEYLADLRLIYADDYSEAKQILSETKLEGFKVLDENLNSGSGEIGVWLAYKTTTNVNEAITDMAVMQMGGGYSAGNYAELIKRAQDEYIEVGEVYLQAIDYFANAYYSGSFWAESAYRQLNFYKGLDVYPDERLGDLFTYGILTSYDLATFFMQGNSRVVKNVRALLAMGVSNNDDGTHYLERVGESAQAMNEEHDVFADEDYEELAIVIAQNVMVVRNMFEELSAYEDELNYFDEEITDLEVCYSEYKAVAEMMRAVEYLDGKSLYDFCLAYEIDTDDLSSLYPLVDALNEGQAAMTRVSCYYDVIRYSMTEAPEEMIDSEISALEETYSVTPVDVYTGVDRSIYEETFALTGAAYRTDAYTDSNTLLDALFSDDAWMMSAADISSGAIDAGLSVWSIKNTSDAVPDTEKAESTSKMVTRYTNMVRQVTNALGGQAVNAGPFIDQAIKKYTFFDLFYDLLYNYDKNLLDADWTFNKLLDCFKHEVIAGGMFRNEEGKLLMQLFASKADEAKSSVLKKPAEAATKAVGGLSFTTLFYFLDASILITSALALAVKVHDHYNPVYDAIPTAMVDVVYTEDGDKYVKYNVVREAKRKKNGEYAAGDLNAFEGQRWNALYYTKDVDAGKPLLADFAVSSVSNRADEGYLPVHRFGEVICYDMNKYQFEVDSDNVFMSVRQSENKKSLTEVPEAVGSIFSRGFLFLACGVGLVFGISGTIGAQILAKKSKKGRDGKENAENKA